MLKIKKILIVVSMILTWLVTGFILVPMTNPRGLVASVGMGLLVNLFLAFQYSLLLKRPASFREWLRQ